MLYNLYSLKIIGHESNDNNFESPCINIQVNATSYLGGAGWGVDG
jgi:hypothetical protein